MQTALILSAALLGIWLSFGSLSAVATYSRVLAAQMYGPHRPYGYVYGGSGGAFKTLSCVENTKGVWDGSVPFVHGSPVSLPNAFTVQAHAMRVLQRKFPQIVDAIEPGGGGDMYAGLTVEEREALAEVTRMGFPALRASSQRQGDFKTQFARVQNLGRVRVVVKGG
jgi:hypothetical protein